MNMFTKNIKINHQISTIKNALIEIGLLLLFLIGCSQNNAVLSPTIPPTSATLPQTDASVQEESEWLNATSTHSAMIVEEISEDESITPTATSIPSVTVAIEESRDENLTPTIAPIIEENNIFYLPDGCGTGSGGVSPDNKWVIYDCEEPKQTWATRLDQKSEPILLIDGYRVFKGNPPGFDKHLSQWSPDSRNFVAYNYSDAPMLLFSVSQWDNPIIISDVSPSHMQVPMWAPDSQKFGFVTLEDSAIIHLVNLDGKIETVIQGIEYALPAFYLTIRGWTADSNHIVYGYNPNRREQLWLLDIQSGQNELLFESDTKLTSWSPYESELVFVTNPHSSEASSNAELFVFDINTRQSKHIAEWELPSGMRVPKRSPDGRWLAIGSNIHIFLYDFDTNQLVEIPQNSSDFYWNPTSEYVLVEEDHRLTWISAETESVQGSICDLDATFTIFHENWSDDGQSVLISVVDSDGKQHLEWINLQINEIEPCK